MSLSISELFFPFIMEIDKGIEEVWETSTNVEEIYNFVVEVEVKTVRHLIFNSVFFTIDVWMKSKKFLL